MPTWDNRYRDRLKLLVQILPVLDREPRFALKGGTAINLYEHDLPRLSVDIDLTWLPVRDFDTDTREIAEALQRIATRLSAPPLRLNVRASAPEGARSITRLIASRGRAQVQIETTPVMRGSVHRIRRMDVRTGVERWSEETLDDLQSAMQQFSVVAAELAPTPADTSTSDPD